MIFKRNFGLIIAITLAILAFIILGTDLIIKKRLNDSSSKEYCFTSFLETSKIGYANGFQIPPFNLKDVTHFKCASKIGFGQYEIEARGKSGRSFFIHKQEGGMAASGADSISNLCFKQDGEILVSEKIVGREGVRSPGSCDWETDYPLNAESIFEYNR